MNPLAHPAVQFGLCLLSLVINMIYLHIRSDNESPKSKNAPWVYVYKTAFILSFIPGPNVLITGWAIGDLLRAGGREFLVFLKEYWVNLHTEKPFKKVQ